MLYHHENQVVTLESSEVSDGQWHYVEARWMNDPLQIVLTLDYGQSQVSCHSPKINKYLFLIFANPLLFSTNFTSRILLIN